MLGVYVLVSGNNLSAYAEDPRSVADLFASQPWMGIATLVLGFAGAGVSVISGEMAEDAAERSGVPEGAIELHEVLGYATFWIFAALSGLRVAAWLGWIREQGMIARLLGIAGVVVMLVASYYGGSLVYDYGAGVTGHSVTAP